MTMHGLERLRSAYYGFWLALSERLGRVRGPRPEIAAGSLDGGSLPSATSRRIEALRARHGVAFEARLSRPTALENYARLALLEDAAAAFGEPLPRGGRVHDVGSASFWYAPALVAAFAPATLTGFELEGFRRLRGGINRAERALGTIASLPGTRFEVADYATVARPAELVTLFFPFVTPAPVLAWRLPLRVLDPAALFARVRANLVPGGACWMVNHGETEAAVAAGLAAAAGLAPAGRFVCAAPLLPRSAPPVVSRWRAATAGAAGAAGATAAPPGTPPPRASVPP
ncbi:MAG: hypothetical protein JSR73_10525 [Proteobacteria bacterium]|nr:hypothetical protein [Pseudomonadota bacterium]